MSGRAWLAGLDPYAAYPLHGRLTADIPPSYQDSVIRPNVNLPLLLPLFALLAPVDAPLSLAAVRALTLLCIVACLIRCGALRDERSFLTGALLLASSAVITTVGLGQIYALLLLLAMAAAPRPAGPWATAGGAPEPVPPAAAALSLGLLAALKWNFGLLLLVLLAAGRVRLAVAAAAVALLATAASFAIGGTALFGAWIATASRMDHAAAIGADLSLLLRPLSGAWVVLPSILLGAASLELCRRARPGYGDALALGLMLSIFLSPLGWPGYCLCLIPSAFGVLRDRRYLWPALLLAVDAPHLGLLLRAAGWDRPGLAALKLNAVGMAGLIAVHLWRLRRWRPMPAPSQ